MSGSTIDQGWLDRRTSEVVLMDGTRALVRPIVPGDKAKLEEGLARLSTESRYFRFLHVIARLSSTELRYLTEVDYHDHFAWVAFASDEPGAPGIGVARYIRDRDAPHMAEAAVTVVDSYQRRGVGRLLLAKLAETARENGVERLVAYVSPLNRTVVELTRRAGGAVVEGGELLRIEVPLDDGVAGEAASVILRAAAAGDLRVIPRS